MLKKRVETIPDYVIDAFNDLLIENYQEDETIIEQEDVIRKILEYSTDDELTRETIFKKHYLDIEKICIETTDGKSNTRNLHSMNGLSHILYSSPRKIININYH